MSKRSKIIVCAMAVALVIVIIFNIFYVKPFESEHSTYKCDVKNFRIATTIQINKDGKKFGEVKGNIFTIVTDPLTLYDTEETKIGYAGDAYHFISQDSHVIYINDTFSVEMVGLVDLLGESYKIYDNDKKLVAEVSFNMLNTSGEMYDAEGQLIADYQSKVFANDFEVRISDSCSLDPNAVLLIFASYYSDQAYDNS